MIYTPKHFQWYEFMPKPRNKAEELEFIKYWLVIMDSRLLMHADEVREFYGKPVTVNNWHSGGQFQFRGWRPPYDTTGAKYSQHRYGRAMDFDVKGISVAQVITDARAGKFSLLKAIETGITWNHHDVRNNTGKLLEFPIKTS